MSDHPPSSPGTPAPNIDQLLVRGDDREREVAKEFLAQSRPQLVAGKSLAWDGFWRRLAGGVDSLLWSFFGGAVSVARAQEEERAKRRPRPTKTSSNDRPDSDPPTPSA